MATEIDSLVINIEVNDDKAKGKLDNLKRDLSGLATVTEGLKETAQVFTEINKSINGLAGTTGKLNGFVAAVNGLSNIQSKIEPLRDVAKAINAIGGSLDQSSLSALSELAASMEKISNSSAKAARRVREVTSESRKIKAAELGEPTDYGSSDVEPVKVEGAALSEATAKKKEASDASVQYAKNLAALKAALSKVAGVLKTVASTAGKFVMSIGKGFVGAINGVRDAFKKLNPLANGFIRALGRIAFYRFIRSIIKSITEGLSEGLKNLYNWGGDNGLVQSLNAIKTAANQLKNSFAAMASPLIQIVAPAVVRVANIIISAFNAINQVISRVLGKSTWTRANNVASEFNSEIGSANNSAKALKATLLSIDEINKLDDNSDGGSGGGGGAGADLASMFTEEAINSNIANLVDDIRAAIERGDWEGAGAVLGERLSTLVDKWDTAELGNKISEKLNHALDFINGAVDKFRDEGGFDAFGTKISDFVSTALSPNNLKKVASTLMDAATGWYQSIGTALSNLNRDGYFNDIGSKLAELLTDAFSEDGLFDSIGDVISEGIASALDFVDSFIEKMNEVDPETNMDGWEQAGKTIGDKISEWFSPENVEKFGENLVGLAKGLSRAAAEALQTLSEDGTISEIFYEAGKAVGDYLTSPEFWELLVSLVKALANALVSAVAGLLGFSPWWRDAKSGYDEWLAITGQEDNSQHLDLPSKEGSSFADYLNPSAEFNPSDVTIEPQSVDFTEPVTAELQSFTIDPTGAKEIGKEVANSFTFDETTKKFFDYFGGDIPRAIAVADAMYSGFEDILDLFGGGSVDEVYRYNEPADGIYANGTANLEVTAEVSENNGGAGWTPIREKLKTLIGDIKAKALAEASENNGGAGWNPIRERMQHLLGDLKAKVGAEADESGNNGGKGWTSIRERIHTLMGDLKAKVKGEAAKDGNGFKWSDVTTSIKNKIGLVSASAKATVTGVSKGKDVSTMKTNLKYLKDNKSVSSKATVAATDKNAKLETMKTQLTEIKGIAANGITIRIDIQASVNNIKQWINTNIVSKLNAALNSIQYKPAFGASYQNMFPYNPISYLATGGITKGAVNAVIGEAGREAVLPLENNTGWMTSLAAQLVDRMGDTNASSDRLLKEQNRILTQILEKQGISTSGITSAISRTNRRTGKTVVAIG